MSEKEKFDINNFSDGLIEYIEEVFKKIPKEHKEELASLICFESVNNATYNPFAAIGILEVTKINYLGVYNEVMMENLDEIEG